MVFFYKYAKRKKATLTAKIARLDDSDMQTLNSSERPKISSVGVDWMTVTTTNEAIGYGWYEMMLKYQQSLSAIHGKISSWNNQWYEGAQGYGWKWGYSQANKGYVTIVSSETSDQFYAKLIGHETNVSRVDTQVTVALTEPKPNYLKTQYEILIHGGLQHAQKCTIIQNNSGGETLYIGSRTSETFLRCYDKGIEQGTNDKGELYRFEVERKSRNARAMQYTLSQAPNTDIKRRFIIADVFGMFTHRGVSPLFHSVATDVVVQVGHRTETTLSKKLIWLQTQVAPTLAKLAEAGLEREAMDALGLTRYEQKLDK